MFLFYWKLEFSITADQDKKTICECSIISDVITACILLVMLSPVLWLLDALHFLPSPSKRKFFRGLSHNTDLTGKWV